MSTRRLWGIFILLNALDVIATLGQQEANAVVAFYYNSSPQAFIVYKLVVTLLALLFIYGCIRLKLMTHWPIITLNYCLVCVVLYNVVNKFLL